MKLFSVRMATQRHWQMQNSLQLIKSSECRAVSCRAGTVPCLEEPARSGSKCSRLFHVIKLLVINHSVSIEQINASLQAIFTFRASSVEKRYDGSMQSSKN